MGRLGEVGLAVTGSVLFCGTTIRACTLTGAAGAEVAACPFPLPFVWVSVAPDPNRFLKKFNIVSQRLADSPGLA
jgi:hypothetical protein